MRAIHLRFLIFFIGESKATPRNHHTIISHTHQDYITNHEWVQQVRGSLGICDFLGSSLCFFDKLIE